jgi:hypothetical protein
LANRLFGKATFWKFTTSRVLPTTKNSTR